MTDTPSSRLLSADVHAAELEEDGDVEVGEVFVVLSGRGVVTFEDGESIDLGPGVAVQLRAGDRTTWTVTERLRKLYVT